MSEDATGTVATEEPMVAEFMFAELFDLTMTEIKEAGEPWEKMSQARQDEVISRADKRIRDAISRAVRVFITHEFPTVDGDLESVSVKDEIKAVIKIPKVSSDRLYLIDGTGSPCRLVIADPRDFTAIDGSVKSDPDQPELNMESGERRTFVRDDDSTETVRIYPEDGEWHWKAIAAIADTPGAEEPHGGFETFSEAYEDAHATIGGIPATPDLGTVNDPVFERAEGEWCIRLDPDNPDDVAGPYDTEDEARDALVAINAKLAETAE